MARRRARDGDWVQAKPAGWRSSPPSDRVVLGDQPGVVMLTGMLAVVKSQTTGVTRCSVNGITVDQTSIRKIARPSG